MVRQTAYLNKKGVTLVEVMISLVILLFVFMGLIQASLVSINSNLRNEIRDAAVSVASEYMSRAKATAIDTLAGVAVCPAMTAPAALNGTFARQVRNIRQNYTVTTQACFTDAVNRNYAQVSVRVDYTVPGDAATTGTQTINSIVKRP